MKCFNLVKYECRHRDEFMSANEGLTSKLGAVILGVIIIVIGLSLTYFSSIADVEMISPRMFRPLGIVIMILGGILIVARDERVE